MDVDYKDISANLRKSSYKYLGSGSGRKVYDLGNGYVVKVAKNRFGISQNMTEYKIALNDNNPLFAKVLHASERFRFLIMEKAEKINNISHIWEYFNTKSNRTLYQIKELQDISSKYHIILSDLGRSANWGQINEKPVIIDYGFTRKTFGIFR